eukprot:SAG25_NODE_177_length_12713_cov_474.755272_12_plen_184_part_00
MLPTRPPSPFALSCSHTRLAWAKTALFQLLSQDVLEMTLDKEKTMPGPRQYMRAIVADINHLGQVMTRLDKFIYGNENHFFHDYLKSEDNITDIVTFDGITWLRKPGFTRPIIDNGKLLPNGVNSLHIWHWNRVDPWMSVNDYYDWLHLQELPDDDYDYDYWIVQEIITNILLSNFERFIFIN